jgi:hypothetical protein
MLFTSFYGKIKFFFQESYRQPISHSCVKATKNSNMQDCKRITIELSWIMKKKDSLQRHLPEH